MSSPGLASRSTPWLLLLLILTNFAIIGLLGAMLHLFRRTIHQEPFQQWDDRYGKWAIRITSDYD
ncbi:hypothetical protein IQ07DRAFT_676438 [Pyrenochaeta sp. DS3sAY3a]|nr:hypothetical protein IQ07DRAFT_676438 [Pyrenochaeta sp. DS3sAY3a]